MWEPRCAPGTPGSVVRAVKLRADELLAVSKRRDVEGKGVLVVVEEEESRGEEEDWRCRRATGIWAEAAQERTPAVRRSSR
jgi:hypothetical protein